MSKPTAARAAYTLTGGNGVSLAAHHTANAQTWCQLLYWERAAADGISGTVMTVNLMFATCTCHISGIKMDWMHFSHSWSCEKFSLFLLLCFLVRLHRTAAPRCWRSVESLMPFNSLMLIQLMTKVSAGQHPSHQLLNSSRSQHDGEAGNIGVEFSL